MATKNSERREEETPSLRPTTATIHDRIAAFGMLDTMNDATQLEKTVRLSLVGFAAADTAAMLQTTTAVVYQNLYEGRKKASTKKPKGKTAAAKGD